MAKKKTGRKRTTKKKRGSAKMAKRRRTRKKAKSSSMFNMRGLGKILGPAVYGASREKVSSMIADSALGKNLPASNFTDEAVMLGLMWAGRKVGLSKGIGGNIIRAGEAIEWARIGETAYTMMVGMNNGSGPKTGKLF